MKTKVMMLNKTNDAFENQNIMVPSFGSGDEWVESWAAAVQSTYYILKRHSLLQNIDSVNNKLSSEKDKKQIAKLKEQLATLKGGVDLLEKQGKPADWLALATRQTRAYVVAIGYVPLQLSMNDEQKEALYLCRKYVALEEMEAADPAKVQDAMKAAKEAIRKALSADGVRVAKVTKGTLNAICKPCRTGVKGDRKTGGTTHDCDKVQTWVRSFWLELFALAGCEIKKKNSNKDAFSVGA